jgi:hypothetical protein
MSDRFKSAYISTELKYFLVITVIYRRKPVPKTSNNSYDNLPIFLTNKNLPAPPGKLACILLSRVIPGLNLRKEEMNGANLL